MDVKRWKVREKSAEELLQLEKAVGVGSLAAMSLISRGMDNPEKAKAFLSSGCCEEDPFVLEDMGKAVKRITEAVERGELIAVFGDYDVDGLTSTTLMYRCLCSLGARVVCSLPSRDDTGYGLSKEAILNLKDAGVTLIVTVDNGVSAFDEVEYATSLGIDTVITDHHVVRDRMPAAIAVVNPHRADDSSKFKELAGVGVALKVAAALEGISVSEAVEEYGLLAAVGTIADIMPLVEENRYIVKRGLELFPVCDVEGLTALAQVTGTSLDDADEGTVSYTISPHLNAAGRMGDAELALRLLLCDEPEGALELAKELVKVNDSRREEEAKSVEIINTIISSEPKLTSDPVLVLAGDNFHSGVMGIVCSRLVEKFNKPVIVISIEDGEAKGSGRSIEGVSLFSMIESCEDMMHKFGGHEMAAGFTMDASGIDEFRKRVCEYFQKHTDGYSLPVLNADGEVNIEDLTEENVNGLRALAPFGNSNKEPSFMLRGLTLSGIYRLGNGKNTRIMLRKGTESMYAACFGVDPDHFGYELGSKVDVVVNVSIYAGHTKNMVSAKVVDIRSSSMTDEDIDSYESYKRLCFSGTVADNFLRVDRNDAAAVYRKIRESRFKAGDSGALAGRVGGLSLGKIMVLVDVFTELGLVKTENDNGEDILTAVAGAPKRELKESVLYSKVTSET